MCGIAGVVADSGIPLELLAKMATTLRHRGPDDEGYVTLDCRGAFRSFRGDETVPELEGLGHWRSAEERAYPVGMCHRRLSILDLSPAGHQPILSSDGNLALVFNGEIYNYVELAAELGSFDGRTQFGDTEVLLAAFARWGPGCVDRLRGMWSFAVYDRRTGRLTLSRDRFGIKPLFYTRLGDSFLFSSEIKGLLPALPSEPRGSVPEAVRLLAWGGVDDGEAVLFEDVRSLPAGCNLHVNCADLTQRLERYYDVDQAAGEFEGNVDDAVDEYRHRVAESVRLHMRSDVEVGSCLSGGLDSSLAASMAVTHLSNGQLTTFTAVYEDAELDERRYVELQAARSGRIRTNFVAPSAEALLEQLDALVWAQDQPMTSSSPFAQWSVMGLAGEQGIKVLLDGQGADEAIGGYSYFAGAYIQELARRGRLLRGLQEARLLREHRQVRVSRELARSLYRSLPVSLRRPARRRTRLGYQLVAPRYRELSADLHEPVLRTFRDHCVDALNHSLPELLRYEDRSSMAFSIESRVPFLDHPLVEFVLSLPSDFKMHNGWSKFVQRQASDALVPSEVVWRRVKLGFTTPQEAWRRELSGSLRDFVREASVPPFLDRARVDRLVSLDLNSDVSLSEFWKTIFFLKWVQVFRIQFAE
jgi:asparagine synthase (glutamine-hydrolysing)